MNESVLVVGGSGYLGRVIAKRLEPTHHVTSTCHRTASPDDVPCDFFKDDIGKICEASGAKTVFFAAATEKRVATLKLQCNAL